MDPQVTQEHKLDHLFSKSLIVNNQLLPKKFIYYHKPSPYYWQNVKCQKLLENPNGKLLISLIKQFFLFYSMDYSLCVFASQANSRQETKRQNLLDIFKLKNKADRQPILTYIVQVYQINQQIKKSKKKKEQKKQSNFEFIDEQIAKNKYHEEQYGQSQGYQMSADSQKLQQYDHFQSIQKM